MLLTEYDYDTDIAVQRQEAYEDGVEKGIAQGLQQGISQGIQQGISQGSQQKAIETAKNMLKEGLSVEQISRCTNLTMEIIDKLKK